MLHIRILLSLTVLAGWSVAQTKQTPAAPQTPAFMGPCSNLTCEVQNDWARNHVMAYGLASAMPEDKFGFKPVPEEQSFGERVLHIAQVNVSLLKDLGAKTPVPEIDPKATSKKDAMAALQKADDYGTAVIKELGDQQLMGRVASPWFLGPMATRQRIIYFLMMHTQDTYGQLVVYLRLNGIVPPASRTP